MDRVLTRKIVVSIVLKKDLMIVSPYWVNVHTRIKFLLESIVQWKINFPNAILELYSRLIASWLISTFKYKIPVFLGSGIAHKIKCGGCSAAYYGKTKRHFKVRMLEHLWVSALNGNRVEGDNNSVIKEYHLFCNHLSSFNNSSILASNNSNFKVALMNSLLFNRDHPPLNKNSH